MPSLMKRFTFCNSFSVVNTLRCTNESHSRPAALALVALAIVADAREMASVM